MLLQVGVKLGDVDGEFVTMLRLKAKLRTATCI